MKKGTVGMAGLDEVAWRLVELGNSPSPLGYGATRGLGGVVVAGLGILNRQDAKIEDFEESKAGKVKGRGECRVSSEQ